MPLPWRSALTCALAAVALVVSSVAAEESPSAEPITVTVTGEPLVVNGFDSVPLGLFGVHAVGITPERVANWGIECTRQIHFSPGSGTCRHGRDGFNEVIAGLPVIIDTQGDRYRHPTVLENENYAEFFTRIGREYAERALENEWDAYVEFWNEPYLNWAERSRGRRGSVYQERWYVHEGREDGGPVQLRWMDEPLEHLRWRRLWASYEEERRGEMRTRIAWSVPLPEGAEVGDTFTDRQRWYWTNRDEREFTVVEQWNVVDIHAGGWWSGPQNAQFYEWMFVPWATAIREANPDVTIIMGWGCDISMGGWNVWNDLIRPIIDRHPGLVDGVCEHHYGSDTRRVGAWYELINAHCMNQHGIWVRGFNTETGGEADPAVHGVSALTGEQDGLIREASRATYHLRDILEFAYLGPDKVGSRTAHHADRQPGTIMAFRLLRDLRGRLIRCESPVHDLWVVSAVNNGQQVVYAFNDSQTDRDVTVQLGTVAGTTMGRATMARIEVDGDANELVIRESTLTVPASGAVTIPLGGKQAVRLVITLAGEPDFGTVVARQQRYANEEVLQWVPAGASRSFTIDLAEPLVADAQRAFVRVAIENVQGPEVSCTVNGHAVSWPVRNQVVQVPVPTEHLQAGTNTVTFTAAEQAGDDGGFRIIACSLVVDQPTTTD